MTLGRYSFIFLILLTSFSCQEPVDLDIEVSDDSLVIYSLFSSDEPNILSHFDVEVYESKGILEDETPTFVEDAEVKIRLSEDQEGETLALTSLFNHTFYRSEGKPEEGKYYEIEAAKVGYPTVFAKSFVPLGVNILNPEISNFTNKQSIYLGNLEHRFNLTFEIQDYEEFNNYYHLLVYYRRKALGPDTPILNHTVGFDSSQQLKDPDIMIINEANEFFGAHIKDDHFNGERKTFDFDLRFLLDENLRLQDLELEIELRSVSEDYYRFYQEANRLIHTGDNPFFSDAGTISNNIENGYGIFAGYSVRRHVTTIEE